MGTEYNLHIVATDIEDFRKQIKQAYEALFPATPAPAAVKKQPKAAKPKDSDTSQKETKPQKKGGRPKVDETGLVCSQCGVTETSQWRRKTAPDGPWCNACHLRDLKAQKAVKEVPTEKKPFRRTTRAEQIRQNLKTPKKQKKAKPVEEPTVSIPKVEIPLEVDGFLTWCITNVPSEMIRSKAFITGSNLVETWYNTIRANDSFIQWYTIHSELFIGALRKVFDLFVARMPTTFIVQDTGDNVVLVATSPNGLKAKALQAIGDDIVHLIKED